ncbi:hypothetical protein PV325_001340 [Microctonus aethiopoides]|uniref:Myb-like domain-containing protein n=1 Tax=Microctonus aethiopoides TaxID=144406 RepID=A0AA39FWV4_9HYME|nr:hypothetical protein PV325_001340 [Microctonus aethiopoides]KAK0092549.1 hypothetical protein PV326_001177 [Microctonus aethiopoides]KAK0177332.1 hypothetical protein PV328_001399 [Microctonus aethiopoides]
MDIRFERSKESIEINNLTNLKNIPWTEKEKKTLLIALKKFGYTDIQNISNELPSKSKPALRIMINKLRLAAKKCTSGKENQIDMWLDSGLFNEHDTVIPQILKFISIFENHPSLDKSPGCNFKVIYDILSQATLGIVPADTSQNECEIISYILNEISRGVWPVHEGDIIEFIDNLEKSKAKYCYPPKRRS